MVEHQPDLERLRAKRDPLRRHEPVFSAGAKSRKPQPPSRLIQGKNRKAASETSGPSTRETGAYEKGEGSGKDSQLYGSFAGAKLRR
jgi:hypothetical protein